MSGPPPLRVSYECAAGGWKESTLGRDLSLGGVFVMTPTALPVGSLVALEIESGSTKAALDGRVLSSRAKAEGPDAPAGFAVRFIDLPLDVQSALHFMITMRTPRKGTVLGLGEAEEGVAGYESERSLRAADGSLVAADSAPELPKAPAPPPPPAAVPPPVPARAPAPAPAAAAPATAAARAPASTPFATSAPAPVPAPAPVAASAPLSFPPPRKSRAPLVVLAIAVVVILVCVAVLATR